MKTNKIIIGVLICLLCCFAGNIALANEDVNTLNEPVKVNEILPEIVVSYQYKQETNTVIATVSSNRELQPTKVSWILSEDKKQYTFEFNGNTKYTTNFVDIDGNVIPVLINVTQVDTTPAKLELSYQYKEETNTVVATVTSNKELQATKVSWTLSEDKKQYTFEFSGNTTYKTNFVDLYGNVIPVLINVTQIDNAPATLEVLYKYKEETNTVIAVVKSNKELQPTKVSWTLSEDKKQYTFEFSGNTTYRTNFVDIDGNVIPVLINVTQVDTSPATLEILYQYNEETNTVLATVVSNKEFQSTKVSWTLSEDKKQYSFEFSGNTTYRTNFVDLYGNVIPVQINVNQIDDIGPELKVEYSYNDERTKCTVKVTSQEEITQLTKPLWEVSADKKTYTYTFDQNTTKFVNFIDKYGNVTQAHINIFLSITGIDVSKHNGKIDWQQVKNFGIQFAILRVGFGQDLESQDDPTFKYNVSECERLGIPYGVYLYSYALNTEHAKSEADHVLRLIKGHNPEYGIWYDLEDADGYKQNNGMPSNETLVDIAVTFCEKMKANGYENVGIYASLDWLNNKLNSSRLDKYDKWVAHWANECGYKKHYVMWQYTDSGKVDGITGNVDMNKYYGKR